MGYRWAKWKRGGRWVDNDEGWHYRHCYTCGQETEHGITEGCVSCGNRAARRYNNVRSVSVEGSKGQTYTVKIYPDGSKYCNCSGFKFRKDCKHVKTV